MIFLNSASSAAALVVYLPGVCTHTDTKEKQRKARVRNILKSLKKTQYSMNTLYIPDLFPPYLIPSFTSSVCPVITSAAWPCTFIMSWLIQDHAAHDIFQVNFIQQGNEFYFVVETCLSLKSCPCWTQMVSSLVTPGNFIGNIIDWSGKSVTPGVTIYAP